MLPVEMVGMPSLSQRISAWVPLPAPGAPKRISFIAHSLSPVSYTHLEVPNFGNAGRGPRLVPGMCIAIEPMVCQYKSAVKTLKDGWTVKTCDGGLAAHFEHTMACLLYTSRCV